MTQQADKSKPVSVAFAGVGWMGSALLSRAADRDDVRVARVFGRNAERGRESIEAAGVNGAVWTGRFEDLVDDPEIDAIFICTPNGMHGDQSIAAMSAGKHVFCEKPCATTFGDYRRQIDLERASPGLVTMVDYILYFDPMEQRLRRMVADGTFGQLKQVQVNYRHPVNIAGEKRWKLSAEGMGDAIGMGVNHAISVIVWLMAPQASPRRVYATSAAAQVRPFEPDPVWNIQIEFDNGAVGVCLGDIDDANGYDAYHNIHGTGGGMVFDSLLDQPQKVRYWSNDRTARKWVYPLDRARCEADGIGDLAWPADLQTPDSGEVINHQTAEAVEHFMDHVHRGEASPLSFDRSSIIAEIGWAAQMSSKLRRPVELPLDVDAASAFFSSVEAHA